MNKKKQQKSTENQTNTKKQRNYYKSLFIDILGQSIAPEQLKEVITTKFPSRSFLLIDQKKKISALFEDHPLKLAKIEYALWNTKQAKKYREQIVALSSDGRPEIQDLQAKALISLISLALKESDTTKEEEYWEQLMNLKSHTPETQQLKFKALYLLGEFKKKTGSTKKAKEYWERAMKINLSTPEINKMKLIIKFQFSIDTLENITKLLSTIKKQR